MQKNMRLYVVKKNKNLSQQIISYATSPQAPHSYSLSDPHSPSSTWLSVDADTTNLSLNLINLTVSSALVKMSAI